jgi:aromatic ring-opening dioxygenase catalytic subunit (LigB family)
MGNIVFAAGVSHAPHMTGFPERAEAGKRERIHDAMRTVGERLRAAKPDVLVVVSSDHFHNLFTDRMPAFCVGIGPTYSGPIEKWIKIDPFTVKGAEEFGMTLVKTAFAQGMDPAFSQKLTIEHGIAVPLSLITPNFDVPIVPIFQNCMVPPLPSLRRCFEFGAMIRAAAIQSDLRVAVIGTGGLSHAPGAPEAGAIDSEFDHDFLARLSSGTPTDILEFSNERIDAAGFGTWEIRQWATALGASGGASAEILAYEPIEEWETGCAAAIFKTH